MGYVYWDLVCWWVVRSPGSERKRGSWTGSAKRAGRLIIVSCYSAGERRVEGTVTKEGRSSASGLASGIRFRHFSQTALLLVQADSFAYQRETIVHSDD